MSSWLYQGHRTSGKQQPSNSRRVGMCPMPLEHWTGNVRIQCPSNSGSLYWNYKKFYSIIMLVLVDVDYKFLHSYSTSST